MAYDISLGESFTEIGCKTIIGIVRILVKELARVSPKRGILECRDCDNTPGVTTTGDISLVRNIVLGYMENPRSVLLAVVPANVDVVTFMSGPIFSPIT